MRALLALLLLAGCAGREPLRAGIESEQACALPAVPPAAPLPPAAPPAALEAAAARLSLPAEATEAADTVGALPALEALAAPPAPGLRGEVARLRLRQEVQRRVLLGMLDVAGTLAALDCEGERGDQLRALLSAREARRGRALNLAAIAFGAGTAAVSGGLALAGSTTAADALSLGGGIGEGAAGAGLLFNRSRAELRHARNMLREVLDGPEQAEHFPPLVWRHLVRPRPDGTTGRGRILAQWRAGGFLGEDAQAALLLGAGGRYGVDELDARDELLGAVEAEVATLHRGLALLLRSE
ncbi:hypothetical protein ACI6QG_07855 [Roseococcus sp. DSY-14]|uniref:hypothetical protein n=1 Tax=Roseococcus sp. DSY-14 TaxID=3369650 RepID=UPI00387B0F79